MAIKPLPWRKRRKIERLKRCGDSFLAGLCPIILLATSLPRSFFLLNCAVLVLLLADVIMRSLGLVNLLARFSRIITW